MSANEMHVAKLFRGARAPVLVEEHRSKRRF